MIAILANGLKRLVIVTTKKRKYFRCIKKKCYTRFGILKRFLKTWISIDKFIYQLFQRKKTREGDVSKILPLRKTINELCFALILFDS